MLSQKKKKKLSEIGVTYTYTHTHIYIYGFAQLTIDLALLRDIQVILEGNANECI